MSDCDLQTDDVVYGDWHIKYDPSPLILGMLYSFCHKDYDGEEDDRRGHGKTVDDCIDTIDTFWPQVKGAT